MYLFLSLSLRLTKSLLQLEEKKKLDQLRKEKEEERQLQELQRLQEEQTGKKRQEKLENGCMQLQPQGIVKIQTT